MRTTTRSPIEAYLHRLSQRLWLSAPLRRKGILREADDHLREIAADLAAQGLNAETAEKEAVRRFGEYPSLARARNGVLIGAAVVALCAGGVMAAARTNQAGIAEAAVHSTSARIPQAVVRSKDGLPPRIPSGVPITGYIELDRSHDLAFADYRRSGHLCDLQYLTGPTPTTLARPGDVNLNCLPDGASWPSPYLQLFGGSASPGFFLWGSVPDAARLIVVTDTTGRQYRFAVPEIRLNTDRHRKLILVDLSKSGIHGVRTIQVSGPHGTVRTCCRPD